MALGQVQGESDVGVHHVVGVVVPILYVGTGGGRQVQGPFFGTGEADSQGAFHPLRRMHPRTSGRSMGLTTPLTCMCWSVTTCRVLSGTREGVGIRILSPQEIPSTLT